MLQKYLYKKCVEASLLHPKITLDTTDKTPEQALDAFPRLAKRVLPTDDLILMIVNP